jgi:D-glycero-alpha-D-manno-heptose 1-phosphate guanylyltransferase
VNYFGRSFGGIEIEYEIETQPLGTGGATRASLARCTNDPVLILNGDTFLDLDMVELDAIWSRYKAPIIVAREVEDTTRYGRLRICDGQVVGFEEKAGGGAGLINAGIYVFTRALLEAFPDSTSFALEGDFLAQHVQRREFRLYVSSGYFIDIGIPEDYERAQRELPRLLS